MVGRNDPCPCGSGKKYKKCCLNSGKTFMESQRTPNMATDLLNELKGKLADTPFSSMEDIASSIMEEQNISSIDDFLGLTSSQMHGILYNPFLSSGDILSLSDGVNLDPQLLSEIPIIKQTLYPPTTLLAIITTYSSCLPSMAAITLQYLGYNWSLPCKNTAN